MKRFDEAYQSAMNRLSPEHPMPEKLRAAAAGETRVTGYGWVKYAAVAACAFVLLGATVILPRVLNQRSGASFATADYAVMAVANDGTEYLGSNASTTEYALDSGAAEEICEESYFESPMEADTYAGGTDDFAAAGGCDDASGYAFSDGIGGSDGLERTTASEPSADVASYTLTDGQRLYYLWETTLCIADAEEGTPLSQTDCSGYADGGDTLYNTPAGLLLWGDAAVVLLSQDPTENAQDTPQNTVLALVYDITDPSLPQLMASSVMSGEDAEVELTNGTLSLIGGQTVSGEK